MPLRELPHHRHALAGLIAAFTLLRLALAAAAPLLPQEAYYWVWSLHPALSYFDHPPLASWTILVTTTYLGGGAFGIKLAAVFWSLVWNVLLARLLLELPPTRRDAFWIVLAVNLTLTYEIFGVGITPDSPLLATWIATVLAVWHATRPGARAARWLVVGAALGLAGLSKYSAALLIPVVVLHTALTPRLRPLMWNGRPLLALATAAVLFLPVLIWNAEHGWVSLAFQSTRRLGELGGLGVKGPLQLLLTQVVLVTPFLFWICMRVLLRPSLAAALDRASADVEATTEAQRLLWLNAAVPLVVCAALSLRSNVHMNWPAPAWWSLLALGVPWAARRLGPSRFLFSMGATAVYSALLLVVFVVPGLPVPRELDNWGGWSNVAGVVDRERLALRARGVPSFVFGSHYKIASELRFHLPQHPRTYAQDVYGEPALHYDFLPLTADLRGATGILVTSDSVERAGERLASYCSRLEVVADLPRAPRGDTDTGGGRRLHVLRCVGYSGHPAAATAPARLR